MGSGRASRLIANLVWLGALFALVAASVLMARGGRLEWFSPGRENQAVRAFQQASPAVVGLEAIPIPNPRVPREYQRERNEGSGIIVDPRGYVLTNDHLVAMTERLVVTLLDGESMLAEVWGSEPNLDLAVLRIKADRPLPFLKMGRSRDLMIGEDVLVIGNALGKGLTCTRGIVSALHREVLREEDGFLYHDQIQIDAAINPGNSGGPLLNIRGELIGVTSSLAPQAEGFGFAIPIDRAQEIVDSLIEYQYVPSAWIGISVANLGEWPEVFTNAPPRGVFVSKVEGSGPAFEKLFVGDVIVSIDGGLIGDLGAFVDLARSFKIGQTVKFEVIREGERRKVEIKLEMFPELMALDWARDNLGFEVEYVRVRMDPRNAAQWVAGIFVSKLHPYSFVAGNDIRPLDQVVQIDRVEIAAMDDFRRAITQIRRRRQVKITFVRGGNFIKDLNIPIRESGEVW